MELSQAIRQRRSVRRFRNQPIPSGVIFEMLEAARLAPSGGNSQDHVFGVVTDPVLKAKLAQAAGNQLWIASAPVVFACCSRIDQDIADLPEDNFGLEVNNRRFGREFIRYMKDCPDRKACMRFFCNAAPLIPAEHIFLTAISHGLHACFVGNLDVEEASRILHLPDTLSCLFLLPVGYADEEPAPKVIKSVNEITFFNCWNSQQPYVNQ